MDRLAKIKAAKKHCADKMGDIIEKNYNDDKGALVTSGTFTALLEAYRACEIAESVESASQDRGSGVSFFGPKSFDQA